jgi:hypothetical protein
MGGFFSSTAPSLTETNLPDQSGKVTPLDRLSHILL